MLNLIIKTLAHRLRTREEGQTFVEYGLIIGGVSIFMLAAFTGLIPVFDGLVQSVTDALTGSDGGGGGGEGDE